MLRDLLKHSVSGLLRAASVLALAGLALMCASLLWPRALLVIFAMSVGHAIGFGAFACYLLAVLVDARQRRAQDAAARASVPPETPASTPNLQAASERTAADD
jgi:hypothetical protein